MGKRYRAVLCLASILCLGLLANVALAGGEQTQSGAPSVEISAVQGKQSEVDPSDRGWLELHFYPCDTELDAPGEILLTDPSGRRVGWDALVAGVVLEIPGSYYGDSGMDDDETGAPGPIIKELGIKGPIEGKYRLSVVGSGSRLYGFAFNFSILEPTAVPRGASVENIRITRGGIHIYEFDYVEEGVGRLELKRIR